MIKKWLMAFRLKTLTAALVPILVATALVHFEGHTVHYWMSIWAILSATFIQIATNLFNDAIDFKKGAVWRALSVAFWQLFVVCL